jgi:hypothetical protein
VEKLHTGPSRFFSPSSRPPLNRSPVFRGVQASFGCFRKRGEFEVHGHVVVVFLRDLIAAVPQSIAASKLFFSLRSLVLYHCAHASAAWQVNRGKNRWPRPRRSALLARSPTADAP